MRKSLSITLSILVVLFVAIGAPDARADSITDGTVNFTVSSGGPSPTGSFVFDSTTDKFTSFTVKWDGVVYNFAPVADGFGFATATESGFWCAAGPLEVSACHGTDGVFTLNVMGAFPTGSFTVATALANGTYTVTETVTTPEPDTLVLFGTGLVALGGVLRRKLTQRWQMSRLL